MILVVGATGRVGRLVVEELASRGEAVRALVRNRDAADLPSSVELVIGDLSAAESLAPAVNGVEATFLVWPLADATGSDSAVTQLARHGGRIVYLSTVGVRDDLPRQIHPLSAMHAAVEDAIRRLAPGSTVLRATKFATNTLAWAPAIRAGRPVELAYGQARRSPIHQRDIAAVAVRFLGGAAGGGSTHVLSGPQSLSEYEQVQLLGEGIGRHLAWIDVAPEAARSQMMAGGASAELADAALAYWARLVTHPEPVTSTVEDITSSPARTFRQWAEEHAAAFAVD